MVDVTEHPDEATFERLAFGEAAASARDALFDHILGCERCARIWRGVLTLHSEAQAEGLLPRDAPVRVGWLRAPVVALALAATLVLAIAGVVVNRRPTDDQAALRGNAPAVVEGLTTTTGSDGVPNFGWTPVATATSYKVDVFSDDGRPVWAREVKAPPTRWPDDAPRAAGKYRWRIDAMAMGALIARSRLAELEVVR